MSSVEHGEIQDDATQESACAFISIEGPWSVSHTFTEPQEEPSSEQTSVALDESHTRTYDPPCYDEEWQVVARADALQNEVYTKLACMGLRSAV